MTRETPEADWKVFRQLRDVALERFCERVLRELDVIRSEASRSHHDRYLAVFRLLRDRDDELARAFDTPRRSQMLFQLAVIHALRLLEPGELARFSPEVRQACELLAKNYERDS